MKRIANIRLTKRTEQGMRMCTLLLFFFHFYRNYKERCGSMENTSDTKRKFGMELEVKDGALLWQSIEIDESKKSV